MSFFKSFGEWFSSFGKKKKKDKDKDKDKKEEVKWDELNYGKPAQPKNLTPIDLDPWKT